MIQGRSKGNVTSRGISFPEKFDFLRNFDFPGRATSSLLPPLEQCDRKPILLICFDYTSLITPYSTACGHRMAYRKWKETKVQPGTAGPGNMLGCSLVSFHFRWAILCPQAVETTLISSCYGHKESNKSNTIPMYDFYSRGMPDVFSDCEEVC